MANDVYRQAHEALATMVSGRAATRVLRQALRGSNRTPDTVSAIEMCDLLMDEVLADLEQILPSDGVRRTLRSLSKQLLRSATQRDAFATEADVPSDLTTAILDDPALRGEAFLAVDREPPVQLEVENRPTAPTHPHLSPTLLGPPVVPGASPRSAPGDPSRAAPRPATGRGRTATGTIERRAPLDEALLRAAVMRFAHLDHVTFVGAVRRGGAVVHSRGGGVDAPVLARRAYSCLALIGRGGELKTYTLQTGDAMLVLAPMGDDLLIVVGTPKLNLGGVFAARSALEEEL